MTQREKLLAAGIAGVLLLWGGSRFWVRYQNAVQQRNADRLTAMEQLGEVQLAETRARLASQRLNEWRDRSLPTDRQVAQSLYFNWLLEQMRASGLEGRITVNPNTPRTNAYDSVAYTVQAGGTLAQLSDFLHAFYDTDQLHKITELRMEPASESGALDITLRFEALMVQGATLTDALSSGTSDRLDLESADAYRESITGRNIFAPFQPPQPPPAVADVPDPRAEERKKALVTYINVGAIKRMWITLRSDEGEKVYRFYEGDRINIAGFRGRVTEIRKLEAVVTQRDGRLLLRMGKSLADAVELPTEAEITQEPEASTGQSYRGFTRTLR